MNSINNNNVSFKNKNNKIEYVPYSTKARVKESLSVEQYMQLNRYTIALPHEMRIITMNLNCTFAVYRLMFLLKIDTKNKLARLIKTYSKKLLCLQDIVDKRFNLKQPLIILEMQSGVCNEKEMRRSLFKNSRASKKKAQIKQKKADLALDIKKHPKNQVLKNKMERLCKDLEIQIGVKSMFDVQSYSDKVVNQIENFVTYIIAISESVSLKQFLSITNLYLGCWFDKSRISTILSYFNQLFFSDKMGKFLDKTSDAINETIENIRDSVEVYQATGHFVDMYNERDDEDMECQNGTFKEIKSLLSNWKDFRTCESAKKLHKFISYVLALGLCETNKLTFTLGRFELFHIQAVHDRDLNFVDMLEMMFDTVIYFVERGYAAFSTGDPWQFLYGDNVLLEYEKTFSYINSYISIIETGNLEHLPETVDSFEEKVSSLKDMTVKMIKDNPTPSYKQILVTRMNMIDKIHVRLIHAQKNISIRERPYSILLYGSSGVGKSAMTNIILNQLMQANGFEPSPLKINSLNANDAFQSDYRSDATCVILDDIANATQQTTKTNHCQLIIDFINNNPKSALKADVDSKGNCPIRPKFVLGTTNVKSLMAHQYSNEPVSIVRRFDVTITVFVKPEFQDYTGSMIDTNKVDPGFKDCWLFDVEKVQPINRGSGAVAGIGYVPVEFEGITMIKITMKVLLQYLTCMSRKHMAAQKALVQNSHKIFDEPLCKNCSSYREFCDCLDFQTKPIPQEINDLFKFNEVKIENDTNPFAPVWLKKITCLGEMFGQVYDKTKVVSSFIENMEEYVGFDNVYDFHKSIKEKHPIMTYTIVWPLLFVLFLFGFMFSSTYIFIFLFLSIIKIIKTWNFWVESKLKFFALKENALVLYRKYDTERNRKYIKIGVLGVVSVVALKKIYDVIRTYNILKIQGSECKTPEPMPDEKPANMWKKPYLMPIPKSTKAWTTTSSTLTNMISENIAYFEGTNIETGKTFFSDIFPLKSNIWLINSHALPDGTELKGKFIRHDTTKHGGNFKTNISPIHTVHIPNTDLAIVYVPSGGDNKDFTPYLPIENQYNHQLAAKLIYKDQNADVSVQLVNAKSGIVGTPDIQVPGYQYTTTQPTFKGLCMATLIADDIGPLILGFHFAGSSGKYIGAASTLTKQQVDDAMNILSMRPGVLLTHSTGDLVFRDLGPFKNVAPNGIIHEKSPLYFQNEDAVFRAFGGHDGARKTYKSSVKPTLISDSVCEIMGQPNIWGPPPNMKGWENWQRDSNNMTHLKELCPTILACAVNDYKASILSKIPLERLKRIHPLSFESALAGADGVYGIDSMNMKSSCGAPINKPKNKILTRSSIPIKGISQPIIAPDYIKDEVQRCEDALLSKERVYFQFSACLKDEPTKNTKIKTRVFCGSPLAATILVRKYFLPFAKLIMENNETFECAVGINAHGPEWDKLTKFITKYGKNRMVAGDYSDYDSTMPASIMLASFSILIDLATRSGYSPDQITIMKGLATEICYPLYEYNGDFFQINGTNPSGQGLTVFMNSMGNSLFMRYAYYQIYPYDGVTTFQDFVALMTYGDDNVMSVSVDRPEFNHSRIAEVLAASDIRYTMADKNAKSVPYISLDEISFLKRGFKYSDEFGMYLAPIEELSLYKTLHSAIESKELTREAHSAQAIDCVLREYFIYGEEYFNKKRVQLVEIANKHQLMHHFKDNELHTYESLKCDFVNKYLTKDISPKSDPLAGKPNAWDTSTLILDE